MEFYHMFWSPNQSNILILTFYHNSCQDLIVSKHLKVKIKMYCLIELVYLMSSNYLLHYCNSISLAQPYVTSPFFVALIDFAL